MNLDKGLIRHWAMLFESGYGLSEEEAEMHEAKKAEYVDGDGIRYSFRDQDDEEEQLRRDSNVNNQMQTVDDRVKLLR